MSVAEIKQTKLNLIAWIEQLSDTSTLAFLDGLKDSTSGEDWWQSMPDGQKRHINEGLKDAREGRMMSSADFWNKLNNA